MSCHITFRASKDMKIFISEYAKKYKLTQSGVVRSCIDHSIANIGKLDVVLEKASLLRQVKELREEEVFLFKLRKCCKRSGQYLRKMHSKKSKLSLDEKETLQIIDERREAIVKEINQIMKRLRDIWSSEGKLEKFEGEE